LAPWNDQRIHRGTDRHMSNDHCDYSLNFATFASYTSLVLMQAGL
jgi:hypothetical protein